MGKEDESVGDCQSAEDFRKTLTIGESDIRATKTVRTQMSDNRDEKKAEYIYDCNPKITPTQPKIECSHNSDVSFDTEQNPRKINFKNHRSSGKK